MIRTLKNVKQEHLGMLSFLVVFIQARLQREIDLRKSLRERCDLKVIMVW